MGMKGRWRWDESYLTGTRDGERKKGEEEPRENTNTPGPERANPGKAREKKKRRPTETNQDQRRGGKDGRASTNLPQRKQSLPKHARTKTYLERGSTHEIGDQWEPSCWQTEKAKGFQFPPTEFVRYSLEGQHIWDPWLSLWKARPRARGIAWRGAKEMFSTLACGVFVFSAAPLLPPVRPSVLPPPHSL